MMLIMIWWCRGGYNGEDVAGELLKKVVQWVKGSVDIAGYW